MKLAQLTKLAREQIQREKEVAQLEEDLKNAKARLREITWKTLPEAMDEEGVDKLELDGYTISVKEDIRAGLLKDKKPEGLAWLRSIGFGKSIKSKLTVTARDDDHMKEIAKNLEDYDFVTDSTIAPQTLSKLIRERYQNGEPVDEDVLSIFRQRISSVKEKK